MELKYIVLTIIKILVSVPTILYTSNPSVEAAALMGGYLDNTNSTNGFVGITFDSHGNYRRQDSFEGQSTEENHSHSSTDANKSEEIPDPSPLVIPGYNLPENIFNQGKPFYMEKDPLTGQVDFTNKTPVKIDDDFYDYSQEENVQSDNIYSKPNIDRKDGSIGSHRPSDINQLSPNFHDFLNLPIKYNSDKYVYPLISSSYANTKVQGNVNKYHNHKTHVTKFPAYKTSIAPFLSTSTSPSDDYEYEDATISTSTPKPTSTRSAYNNMNGPNRYPSFSEDFSDDYYDDYEKNKNGLNFKQKDDYTTKKINNIYLTTSSPAPPVTTTKRAPLITTTRRVMSLFEQLFGEYEDTVTTTEKIRHHSSSVSTSANENKNPQPVTKGMEEIPITTQSTPSSNPNVNVATGSNMEMDNLYEEYSDYSYNNQNDSEVHTTHKPYSVTATTARSTTTLSATTTTIPSTSQHIQLSTIFNSHSYREPNYKQETPTTRQRLELTTRSYSTPKVTSLPLGENHVSRVTPSSNEGQYVSDSNIYRPIIIATQNLRDQLNHEKIIPKPFSVNPQHAPSTSSIHIAPDQDTVSFVVGHHQSMDGGSYADTNSHNGFSTNSFQPIYGEGTYEKDDIIYNNSPDTVIFQQPQLNNHREVSGSVVTIQTQTNSEASLSIGVPIEIIKKVPGQVMDADLELDNVKSEVPQKGNKIVFPNDGDVLLTSVIPPQSTPNSQIVTSNREILKLASKPMYHQLPSDLTPPKEKEGNHAVRLDSPRPPWDPRPGHFFSGKLEYSRPPRPYPDMAYKRIDILPNILPQFRPNTKSHVPPGTKGHEYKHSAPHGVHRGPPNFYENRLHREPLLERPSNRPLQFYEKLQPPPLPPKNLHNLRKIPPSQFNEQRSPIAQDRKGEDYHKKPFIETNTILEPPRVITNLKKDNGEVETLQMLQAKQSDKKELHQDAEVNNIVHETNKTDKPVYVVYPVNTPPIKLDVIDSNKRESVVIGTRAELPLPPSEITGDFIQDKNSILAMKDRKDSPILKPHSRPQVFPTKTDFPYPLERPDISILHAVPDAPNNGIGSEDILHSDNEGTSFMSNNQWNTIDNKMESRIVNGNKVHSNIYSEKPIAVAYTPTEPSVTNLYDKYSIPHFSEPNVDSSDIAIVHHHFPKNEVQQMNHMTDANVHSLSNHRIEENSSDNVNVRTEQDFQAPFQASVKVDSPSQGWSVIRRNDSKSKNNEETDSTTAAAVTTSEFDIEHFKPQLEGGFKPIYSSRTDDMDVKVDERQE